MGQYGSVAFRDKVDTALQAARNFYGLNAILSSLNDVTEYPE